MHIIFNNELLQPAEIPKSLIQSKCSLSPIVQTYFTYLYIAIFFKLIYLFLAALGLCCSARAFSSCGERGPLFIAVRGLLTVVASLVAEHRL